ncbi:GNAT family N-acetyltransferase [Salegentibacter sp. LM13S]|uniref:GNAT family N-acetyltransferase n=1 Tax=Salegentibacter lacus TaxID=2873599 RepID=UPI001CCECBC4|nr:GNAT family N-acetyltransferase [Salegentibacter lacus]MBZ9629708.1 GNAT family N-acetyltransferase [Salegentibacter lacus]
MSIQLKTNRLLIKLISLSDLEKIHELHSLPGTDRFNTLGIPENLNQTESIIKDWIKKNNNGQNKNFTFKVELIGSKTFIGLISLNLGKPKFKIGEVWYKFHSDFWNKGYATESLKKILEFAFCDLDLHRIEAGCAVENIGSIRTLEKVGMTREGRKRKVLPLKDGWSDNFEYAILSTDLKSTTHNII